MANDFGDVWTIISSRGLAVASNGGASASTAAFGSQTYLVQLCFPGSTSSTGGVFIAVGFTAVQASSTSGMFLPANWVYPLKVSPGQTIAALSADAATPVLNIVELTK